MASNFKRSTTALNTEADAVCALANTGYVRIYNGTQATNANTAVGAQTLLAELRFGATAFGAASSGVATANAITDDSSADATGTASWFRVLKSDGTTVIADGNVGTSGTDMVVATTSFVAGAVISITSMTYTATTA